jgi:hypothetical protein
MNVETIVTASGLQVEIRSERDLSAAVHDLFVSLAALPPVTSIAPNKPLVGMPDRIQTLTRPRPTEE